MYTKVQHFTGLFDRSTTRRIYAQSTARASEFLHLNSCTVTSGARLLRRIGHRLVSLQSGDNSRQVSGDDHRQVNVLQCVSMVGSCNLACKSLGLLREVFIASNYGVGWMVDSFSHASLIPSGFLALGGLNGPIHSAVGAALSLPSDRASSRRHLDSLFTTIVLLALISSLLIFAASNLIVVILCPGLRWTYSRAVALQLQLMSPCVLLASICGIFNARLETSRSIFVAVLSPAISSLTIIGFLVYHSILYTFFLPRFNPEYVLAAGTTFGAILQCFVLCFYTITHYKGGSFRLSSLTSLGSKRVQQSNIILFRACMTSGVLHIAAITDLLFASFLPGAAAANIYANIC